MSMQRNTIFALLMAMEHDLRRCVEDNYPFDIIPLSEDEIEQASRRYSLDRGNRPTPGNWQLLLNYLDLSQLLDLMARHDAALSQSLGSSRNELQKLVKQVRLLAPIRNRVCHARPLEPEDFVRILDATRILMMPDMVFQFSELKGVRHDVETNAIPLTISIPQFWREDIAVIPNNLPTPEFDDTGFVGRTADREKIMKLLLGPRSVITVTGEGGVGKTSTTLLCLYDLSRVYARVYAE